MRYIYYVARVIRQIRLHVFIRILKKASGLKRLNFLPLKAAQANVTTCQKKCKLKKLIKILSTGVVKIEGSPKAVILPIRELSHYLSGIRGAFFLNSGRQEKSKKMSPQLTSCWAHSVAVQFT